MDVVFTVNPAVDWQVSWSPWRYCCRLSAFMKELKTSHPKFSCGQKGKQTKSDINTHHPFPWQPSCHDFWPPVFPCHLFPDIIHVTGLIKGRSEVKSCWNSIKTFIWWWREAGGVPRPTEGIQHPRSRHYYGSVLEYFGLLKWEEITLYNSLVAVCRLTDNISISRASK